MSATVSPQRPDASCEVVTTRQGARAMLDRTVGELMHPVVGPTIEAERLYVEASRLAARLAAPDPRPLVLFDVGLGAGSNAIAAWQCAERAPTAVRHLEIVSFDWSLAAFDLAQHPTHARDFGLDGTAGEAARTVLTHGRWEGPRSTWRLVLGELPETLEREPEASADVVFWDPFSPRANPSLWTVRAFRALRRACRDRATVQTYSGATSTRAALLLAGFAVGFGEVTGEGKRATCAAIDIADIAEPLDARWLARLARSSAALPIDADAEARARIEGMPQFRVAR